MQMEEPRSAEGKEELPIEKLSRRLKDLEQDWQSFQNPNLRCRRRRYSSADADKTVMSMNKDDQYHSNMMSPRQLMGSLQLQTASPPSTEYCRVDLNHDESAVCEIQRDRRKFVYGSLKGRRLFEDSECGSTSSGIVTTASQLCVHEEVCGSFSTDLVKGTVAETESMISYACINTGHVTKKKSSEECCRCSDPCIKVKEDIVEQKESNAVGWGGGQNRREGAGGGGGDDDCGGRKTMMVTKACVVFAFLLSMMMGIIMIRRSLGGDGVEEKVFFLVPT